MSTTGPAEHQVPHDPTLAVYEAHADRWRAEREPPDREPAQAFAERLRVALSDGVPSQPVVDLGCGPGWFTADLVTGTDATPIALDYAAAMLDLVPEFAPGAVRLQASLTALPFRRGALGGAYANKSYVHVAQTATPLALADLHRATVEGAPVELLLFEGDVDLAPNETDDFPGREFSKWPEARLADVVVGAGFTLERIDTGGGTKRRSGFRVIATRARTLPDTVGPGMRLLMCGLNPSVYSADVGSGFARGGNRYWPAALAAGLVSRARDPWDALRTHRVGMTDVVKRATARADELSPDEYREGMARVGRLVEWLQPKAVCFVGLAGWRTAVDRKAVAGVQPEGLGGVPVYVMPSTSGLNAHSSLDDLTGHLREAMALADS
ncbi:MAG: methyltransferase domain-containing protein [Acidimicrobiales bacterium]|nr:methyltransferase domain-containing protein [Acidimicrobiales bacterium]